MSDFHVISTDGQFDARKARQFLYEFARDNREVNKAIALAAHLGLSSEDEALLMAVALLQSNEGLLAHLMEDIRTRVPTFQVQATQGGPFETKRGSR